MGSTVRVPSEALGLLPSIWLLGLEIHQGARIGSNHSLLIGSAVGLQWLLTLSSLSRVSEKGTYVMSTEEPSPKPTFRLFSVLAPNLYLASVSEARMMSSGTMNLGCCGSFSVTRNLSQPSARIYQTAAYLMTPSNTVNSSCRGAIPASLAVKLALILEPVKSMLEASTLYANSGSAVRSSRFRVQKGFCERGGESGAGREE